MTIMTVHRTIVPVDPRSVPHRTCAARRGPALPRLVALAAVAAILGSAIPAAGLGVLVGAATGSAAAALATASLWTTFLPVAAVVTAVWLAGAIQTGRTIRDLQGLSATDCAAIGELGRLLGRA
jgi:hypothetical protein